ncbi:MAG: gamma-glutamyl-gamma-aminobutyrate hydrolase family protein [Sedimentisphaerales bacterium]|nr:gamma-glutamyl-gamma-aminobutyrate hydrolase family protein [Sedimentisphaerales bacterium]
MTVRFRSIALRRLWRPAGYGILAVWLLLVAGAGCQSPADLPKPLIGISSVYRPARDAQPTPPDCPEQPALAAASVVPYAYIEAVSESGGVPVLIPSLADKTLVERYLALLDGLVLIGGADIPPAAYGQTPHSSVEEVPPLRFAWESRLAERWYESGKPLLGVCLGMQLTNVVRGGTLIQDIPSQVGTMVVHRGDAVRHKVIIEPDSRLYQILQRGEARVYSSHHQAVAALGAGLRIAARSADGVAEALERTDGPFGLFVQWHPEAMNDAGHRRAVYGALIDACRRSPAR